MQTGNQIDLHCHILPGMDDGSPDVETSLKMLHQEVEQEVGFVCATSHYYADQNTITTFCKRRAESLEKLLAKLPKGSPWIIPAAEVAFFSGISEHPHLERLCIKGTRTMMLEMPFSEWNDFQVEEISTLVLDRGIKVVLVHPERFCGNKSNRKKLRQLEQLPVALQVNAGSLLRWRTRGLALELLREAPMPLLGSDCHNMTSRPPNLKEGKKVISQKLGEAFLNKMDHDAAQLIQLNAEKGT